MSLLTGQILSKENLNAAFMSKAMDNYIFSDIISTGAISALSITCNSNLTSVGTVNGLTLASTQITAPAAFNLAAGGTNQDVTITPSGTGRTILKGNVGIGNLNPVEELDVVGNIKLNGNFTDGTNSVTAANMKTAYTHSQASHLGLGTTSTTAYRGDYGNLAYAHISSDGSSHTFINQDVKSTATPAFAGINNTGRIQIGTEGGAYTNSAPRAISWYSSAYKTWATYMAPAGATAGYNGTARTTLGEVTSTAFICNIENTAGYGWIWESGPNTTAAPTAKMALSAVTGNLEVIGSVKAAMSLLGTNAYTVAANGVGYGLFSSDSYKIYMSSTADVTFGGKLDTTSDYNMYFKMTGGTNRGFVFRNGTVNVAQIDGSGNIYTNGKIGIGVSSAEKLLHVNSVNTHAALFENSGPYWDVLFKVTDGVADKRIWGMGAVNNGTTDTAFVLGTMVDSYASTERIRVTQDGKVGIGTATPAETLHVAGNLKVDGSINGSLGTVTFTKYQIVYNSTEDSLDFVYTG